MFRDGGDATRMKAAYVLMNAVVGKGKLSKLGPGEKNRDLIGGPISANQSSRLDTSVFPWLLCKASRNAYKSRPQLSEETCP